MKWLYGNDDGAYDDGDSDDDGDNDGDGDNDAVMMVTMMMVILFQLGNAQINLCGRPKRPSYADTHT